MLLAGDLVHNAALDKIRGRGFLSCSTELLRRRSGRSFLRLSFRFVFGFTSGAGWACTSWRHAGSLSSVFAATFTGRPALRPGWTPTLWGRGRYTRRRHAGSLSSVFAATFTGWPALSPGWTATLWGRGRDTRRLPMFMSSARLV